MVHRHDKLALGSISLFYFILVWLISDHQLFWDTVQFGGKHPNFFYIHPFEIILPTELDSGHIPAFGYYISLCWQVFGRSLTVTHWAMFPFLLGMAYQIYLFCKPYFEASQWLFFAPFFLLLDPTLLAQSTLVSPDICLVFFFFLLLNAIDRRNKLFIIIASLGLVLISNRGTMVVCGVGVWAMIDEYQQSKKIHVDFLLNLMPAVAIFVAYHYYHYRVVGWVFYHDLSPWAPSFQKAEGITILKNIFLLSHRILDFGRIVLLLLLGVLWRHLFGKNELVKNELGLVVLLIICLGYPFISHIGLNGHRYLLPIILILELIWLKIIISYGGKAKYFYMVGLFALLLGHFIKYPSAVSQGWDASLAHMGFFKNQRDFYQYIEREEIQPNHITTSFPLLANHRDQYISNKDIQLSDHLPKAHRYVLLTDLANKYQLDTAHNYQITKHFKHLGINFYLYKRK